MQSAFFLAQKMGKSVERSKILQRSLPEQQGKININPEITLLPVFCYLNK